MTAATQIIAVEPVPKLRMIGFTAGICMGPPVVHVQAPRELFGLTLASAAYRADDFQEPDRTLILDLQRSLRRARDEDPHYQLAEFLEVSINEGNAK